MALKVENVHQKTKIITLYTTRLRLASHALVYSGKLSPRIGLIKCSKMYGVMASPLL